MKAAATSLLQLVIRVDDPTAARVWLEQPPLAGIEGVVAKRDEAYPPPTARRWRRSGARPPWTSACWDSSAIC